MDTDALIGKAITRSHAIDKLLRKHYPEAKVGLHAAINSLADTLPAILVRAIRVVAIVRNAAAHPDGFKPDTVPPDFDRLCSEIELLIPYFASQHAKPTQPSNEPKPPASKPKATAPTPKPQNNSAAANTPANQGKPWTPEEDKKLTDAFDAQMTIPELAKAHQRGVGGIQGRLTKLGRLTADQYKTYPPESQ
jgi:hypothetical protein